MNQRTKKFVTIGMLIALQFVAGRFFTITLPTVKIGFSFLPIVIVSMLYGPLWGGIAGAIGDIITAPFLGSYFPPLTISAILSGVIYGVFLYRKPKDLRRVILAVVFEGVFISLLLQTYFLSLMVGKGFLALLSGRAFQNLVNCPIRIICIYSVAYRIRDIVEDAWSEQ